MADRTADLAIAAKALLDAAHDYEADYRTALGVGPAVTLPQHVAVAAAWLRARAAQFGAP